MSERVTSPNWHIFNLLYVESVDDVSYRYSVWHTCSSSVCFGQQGLRMVSYLWATYHQGATDGYGECISGNSHENPLVSYSFCC